MKKLSVCAVFIWLLLLIFPVCANAEDGTMTLPSAMKVIEREAFYGVAGLDKVVIPEGVTEIHSLAFVGCSLTEVVLPSTLTYIADDAFDNQTLAVAEVKSGSYAEKWCIEHDFVCEVLGQTDETQFTYAIQADGTAVVLRYIGKDSEVIVPAFLGGDPVSVIGKGAFEGCQEVKKITIPAGVISIEEFAFNECQSLEAITLPKGLQYIGDLAFQDCRSLLTITLPKGVKTLGWNILNNCLALKNAYIPSTVTTVGELAIEWDVTGAKITVYGDVAMYSFYNWTELKGVTVEDGCTYIGEGAFMDCSSLEYAELPESIIQMDTRVFADCRSLSRVNIPNRVTSVGDFAFSGCNISEIVLPENLKTIGRCAFQACYNLNQIDIPYGTETIADSAFLLCEQLKKVYMPSTLQNIDAYAFRLTSEELVLVVTEGSTAHQYAQQYGLNFELRQDVISTPSPIPTAAPTITPMPTSTPIPVPVVSVESVTYHSVTLTWPVIPGATSYVISHTETRNGAGYFLAEVTENRFTHEELLCNTEHYYCVRALFDQGISSNYSNYMCAVTADHVIELAAPTGLTVTPVDETSLLVSWQPVPSAAGYDIYCNGQLIISADYCGFIWSDLTPATEYTFSVQAYAFKNDDTRVDSMTSQPVTCMTPDILSANAVISQYYLELFDPIEVTLFPIGAYGTCTYRYLLYFEDELLTDYGTTSSRYFDAIARQLGTYSVVAEITDELGRTVSIRTGSITVRREPLEVAVVTVDKSIVMAGSLVEITVSSNRAEEELTLTADVYCNGNMTDTIQGMGRLSYTPAQPGVYAFAVNIADCTGDCVYVYLDNVLTVTSYWQLSGVTVNAESVGVGSAITLEAKIDGAPSGFQITFEISKDGQLYRQIDAGQTTQYTFNANEAGVYSCICTVTDAYHNTVTMASPDVSVSPMADKNPTYNETTHGNTLKAEDVKGMDSDDVRVAQSDLTITWDRLSTDSYYEVYIECYKLGLIILDDENYQKNSFTIPASKLHKGYEYDVTIERYNASGKRTETLDVEFLVIGGESLLMEADPKFVVPAKYASVNYDDLTLQWKQLNYANTIDIILEYNCGCDDHELLRTTIDGKLSSFTIPKALLQDGKMHTIRMIARDTLGNSKSARQVFYVGCTGDDDLRDINDPVLNNSYMSDGSFRDQVPTYPVCEPIQITWEENPYAAYFSLHLEDYDNGDKEIVYTNIHTNSYTVQPSALVSGHRYQVVVYAHHTEDCYEKSDDMWFRAPYLGNLLLDPPKVLSPDLSMQRNDPTVFVRQDLTVTWTPVSAATTYDVQLHCIEDDCIDFEAKGLKTPSVTIPKENVWVDDELTYSLLIYAYDAAGNETCEVYYLRYVDSTITAPALISPALPTVEENCPSFKEDDLKITWSQVEGAVSYRVQVRDLYNSHWDIIVDAETVKETSYIIPQKELYEGGLFRVRVKAIDQYGNGKYSENYYFRIGDAEFVELTLSDWNPTYQGGSKNFFIQTSQNWSVKSSASWLTLNANSGSSARQLTMTATENKDAFPRTATLTFSTSGGGCAVLTVVQAGNGSANAGSLRITSPEQGETLQMANFRINWSYKYDHAYYNVTVFDVSSGKMVHEQDQIIVSYEDVPKAALAEGHVYQITVAVYNAQKQKISESSVVVKTEGISGDVNEPDIPDAPDQPDEPDDPEISEGTADLEYEGLTNNAKVSKQSITVSWKNVTGAGYYTVALRDMTLYPDDTQETNIPKVINTTTQGLSYEIPGDLLTYGHTYRLWIGVHKSGMSAAFTGKNIVFTVVDEDESADVVSLLTLSVENWNCDAASSIRAVAVICDGDWAVASKPSWITVYQENEISASPVLFALRRTVMKETGADAENVFLMKTLDNDDSDSRTGKLTVTDGTSTKTIRITQNGKDTRNAYTILSPVDGAEYSGKSIPIEIVCAEAESVRMVLYRDGTEIRTFDEDFPVSNTSLTVENNGRYTLAFTFYDEDGNEITDGNTANPSIEFTVKEPDDPYYDLIQTINISVDGGSQTVPFENVAEMTLSFGKETKPGWLKVSYSQLGTLVITVEENDTGVKRECMFDVITDLGTKTIEIIQNANNTEPLKITATSSLLPKGLVGQNLYFGVLASGGAGNYRYTFELIRVYGGNTSSETITQSSNIFIHKITEPGTYKVKYSVTDSAGKTTESQKTREVVYEGQPIEFANPSADSYGYPLNGLPTVSWKGVAGAASYGVKIEDLTSNTLLSSFGAEEKYYECGAKHSVNLANYQSQFAENHKYSIGVVAWDKDGTLIADSSIKMLVGMQKIEITAPANESTLSASDVTIQWAKPNVDANYYDLYVYNAPGYDLAYTKENAKFLDASTTSFVVPKESFGGAGQYRIKLFAYSTEGSTKGMCLAQGEAAFTIKQNENENQYTNPTLEEIKAYVKADLIERGRYTEDMFRLAMAVAQTESQFTQFKNGEPYLSKNTNGTYDIGIMQINSSNAGDSLEALKYDWQFNVRWGVGSIVAAYDIAKNKGEGDYATPMGITAEACIARGAYSRYNTGNSTSRWRTESDIRDENFWKYYSNQSWGVGGSENEGDNPGGESTACNFNVTPSQWQLGSYSASNSFTVTYDSAWSINEAEIKASGWLSDSVSDSAGGLTLTATENTGAQREFDVVISCNAHGTSKTIHVVQREKGDINSKRQAVVDRAYVWYNTTWQTQYDLQMWNTSKVVPAGSWVRGIPYSSFVGDNSCTYTIDDCYEIVKPNSTIGRDYFSLSDDKAGKYKVRTGTATGGTRTGPAYGAECTNLVWDAWYAGDPSIGIREVSGWSYVHKAPGVEQTTWIQVLPGDMVNNSGHRMLIVEINDKGTPNDCTDDVYTVIEQAASNLGVSIGGVYTIGTSKNTYTYSALIDASYLPYRYTELDK